MKFILTTVAILYSIFSFAANGVERRCATTAHMKYIRDNHPNANTLASSPDPNNPRPDALFYIPVVVHVLWNTSGQNISDAQIFSQIDVLNEDYARTNSDAANTPGAFAGVASSTNFRFCLAKVDPNGNLTTGIERRQTSKVEFQTDDQMKHFGTGGLNIWDPDRYLNIWVCNLADDILGYAETPDVVPHTNTFGVVIAYNAFGRTGVATPPYNLGRTATHEVGHCFNLWHTWGDDNGNCGGFGDGVSDTPDQASETFNCVNFPKLDTCSNTYPGIMFMNYMDYSDDNCMNIFTAGQATRMYNEINNYYPLLLTSTACSNVGIDEMKASFSFSIYPNPSNGIVSINLYQNQYPGKDLKVALTNVLGKVVYETNISNPSSEIQLNFSNQSKGVYVITLSNEKYRRSERVILN